MERKRLEFGMMRHHEMTSHGSQSGERDKRSMEAGSRLGLSLFLDMMKMS